jgi:site-specific DNA recombinase
MSRRSELELKPRNGHTLVVTIVARISGCAKQKELSLEDQVDHAKEEVGEYYKGPIEYVVIATKGKGENLERPELKRIEKLARSGRADLLVMEDVGRLVRGAEACRLFGIAVDHGTRVLAPNDCIDTADESWEEDVMAACRDHTSNQTHTSKRLKKKLMTRFERSGQITPCAIAGYIRPLKAESFADWAKDDSATPIIREGRRLLKRTLNGSVVAAYFNGLGFKPGPYCRREKWDGTMVLRFYRNPLLKGMPCRGTKHTVKHHESGRRIAVRNPKGPKFREEPHLAHLETVEFDELNVLLHEKNAKYRRHCREGVDPRCRIPRKRTRAFGQHALCWYCGRHYVWGGNGITDNLMCSGAREWKCWNSVGFNGPLAARILLQAISDRLSRVQGVEQQYRQLVFTAKNEGNLGVEQRRTAVHREEQALAREKKNIIDSIVQFGPREILKEKLAEIDNREKLLAGERHFLAAADQRTLVLPDSTREIRASLQTDLRRFGVNSWEFGELMKELVPEFHVYLVRLCDGGHLLPRAKVRLDLLGSFADAELVPGLSGLLAEELTVDLFIPPQRELIRNAAVQLAQNGREQRAIAESLPGRPTQTAVWRALELQRKMSQLGLSSPYVNVSEPPADYAKLRRHKNAQFCFQMLEGYERPEV